MIVTEATGRTYDQARELEESLREQAHEETTRTIDPIVKAEPTSQLADLQQTASDIFADPFGSAFGLLGQAINPLGTLLNPQSSPLTALVDTATGGGLTKGAGAIIESVPFLGPLAGMADMAGMLQDPIGFLTENPMMIAILGGCLVGGIILLKVIL